MNRWYRLDGHTPVACTPEEWDDWAVQKWPVSQVAKTEIDGAEVSTVFLSLDHSHSGHGPPLLFETMVFGGTLDGEMRRCSTWEEAEAQHETVCEMVRAKLNRQS